MSYEEAFEDISSMLSKLITHTAEQEQMMGQVFKASEERIDRINTMVTNLTAVMSDLTKTYTSQIAKLADSRDELLKQNSKFIEVLENIHIECIKQGERYNHLLDKYERLAEHRAATNNISVK